MTASLRSCKKSFEKCCQLGHMFDPLRKIRPETQSYLLNVVIDFKKKEKTESNSIDCLLPAELMEQNNRWT